MKQLKLGHQAPHGYRVNKFNSIEIRGDFAYCESHNFVYNTEEEKMKLYNGLPCYYTDARFSDGKHNSFGQCKLRWTRHEDFSLNTCIRNVLRCKNIPHGTLISFQKSWYTPKKKINNSFNFIVKKENNVNIEYEINEPSYSEQFTNCDFSKKLTDALRSNGFIVSVRNNSSHINNMLNTAIAYTGGNDFIDSKLDGEVAIAYGHGKKIGFSSFNNPLMGYYDGRDNILWDNFGEFDKWSKCNQIDKTVTIEDILKTLMS